MRIYYLLYLIANLALESTASYAQCYAPDGSTGYAYLPCIADIHVDSMCCVLNITALELIGETEANLDTCLPNGLCQFNSNQYSRDLCTDKTWTSPNCLNICAGGSDGGTATTSATMTLCADGTWCCGQQNTTGCCDKNLGFKLAASIAPFAASSTAATATTIGMATIITTSSMPASNTPSSSASGSTISQSSTNSNNSLGIGLGVALGLVLLAVAAVGLFLYRRHRARVHASELRTGGPDEAVLKTYIGHELPQPVKIHEASHIREPVELGV